jgi:uncharacterized repeat protein (TIGR01451 family)
VQTDLVYNPALDLEKTVTSVTGGTVDGKVNSVGDVINYGFSVENTGNITLTGLQLSDPMILPADLDYASGDDDNDGDLDVGETWLYTGAHTVTQADIDAAGANGFILNTATATTNEGAEDTDDASVQVDLPGPGVRTPGFWSNNGSLLWDGKDGTLPKAGGLGIVNNPETGTGPDLAYLVDSNNDGVTDTRYGLLLGDWNKNGVTDGDEHTQYVSRADALSFLNASEKALKGDGRWMLARDVVATWLNFLAGNGVGTAADEWSPRHYEDDAIIWLTGKTNGDFQLTKTELSSNPVSTSSAAWTTLILGLDKTAADMHSSLDGYNNTGTIHGHVYAQPEP